jgi:hypothetical protein
MPVSDQNAAELEVVYVALGESFLREAAISAWSVKRHMPGVPVTVLTDCEAEGGLFNSVVRLPPSETARDGARRARVAKAQAILGSCARHVLYLDTDTYVMSDISDVAEALARFDLALAHDTWRYAEAYRRSRAGTRMTVLPDWYPYFNAGVIFARRCRKVDAFLERWAKGVTADGDTPSDQTVLRRLLYESDLKVHTLPPEYNARPGAVHMSGRVHVLHTRMSTSEWRWSMPLLGDFLNSDTRNRCYTAHDEKLVIVTEAYEFLERRLGDHRPSTEREEFLRPPLRFPEARPAASE